MTFEEWFNSGDPIIDRIGNSPDIMWQLQQTYIAAQTQQLLYTCAAEKENDMLRGYLEDLCCDARYLSDHEMDGGAPDNRWEDMRIALMVAEDALNLK